MNHPLSLLLYCPERKAGGTVDITRCIYLCPRQAAVKCAEYLKAYPQLAEFIIAPKYIEKYGAVEPPVPLALRRRKQRRPR